MSNSCTESNIETNETNEISGTKYPLLYKDAKMRRYKYWKKKPVMKLDEKIYVSNQIKNTNELQKYIKKESPLLPEGYEWEKIDLDNQKRMKDISDFLTKYYCRGTDSEYIIKYDPERLKWEMCNVGYFLTVINSEKNIAGLIGFTNVIVKIYADKQTMAYPLYMCCDKKYREKGLAKILMDEIIRQSFLLGIEKGIFCNNHIVPKPVATLRQYSRPLNYKKLRDNDFIEIYNIDEEIIHTRTKINLQPNKKYIIAEKNKENIDIVYNLYTKYMETFSLHMILNKHEIANYLFDNRYVKTILVMNEKNKPIDFISYNFYDIINTNIKEENKDNKDTKDKIKNNNTVKAANILMYSSNEVRVDLLFTNILKQISADKIHIVYITDMMHNNESILSIVKNADEDTDDEEENTIYDMNIVKTGKKFFINLFNWQCNTFRQDMVSWLIF